MFLKLKNEKAFSLVIVLIILTVGIAALTALSFIIIRGFQSSRGLINAGIAYNAMEIGVKEFDYQLLDVVLKNDRFRGDIPNFSDPEGTDLDANGLLLKAKCFYYAWDNNDDGEIDPDNHKPYNTRCVPRADGCNYGGDPDYFIDPRADVFTCGNTDKEDTTDPTKGGAILGNEIPEEFSDCCEVLANRKQGNNNDCKKNYTSDYFNDNIGFGIIEDIYRGNQSEPPPYRVCLDNGSNPENNYCRRDCYKDAWRGWGQDAWRCVNKNAVVRYTIGNPDSDDNEAVNWILEEVQRQASGETCKATFENKEDASGNKIIGLNVWHEVPINAGSPARWRVLSMERSGLSGSMSGELRGGRIKVVFEGEYSGSKVKAEANWYQLSTNTWTQETHLISD